jgi:3-deoxy-manno-octulosonate cytidylyltransferase (CMP-KDO synthetase)|tara:strand:+ start:406 stop:1020 length:615 start_codon:yes stop_codon:yes gene_type:complete
MIKRVYDRVKLCKELDTVVVLTDDKRIYNYCLGLTMPVEMIVDAVRTGTDRCAKAVEFINGDIFVNIQGDEPLINPDSIDSLIQSHTGCVSNAYVTIDENYKLHDKNVVKVSIDKESYAKNYSRVPIAYRSSPKQQLGLYVFDRAMLELFPKLPIGKKEQETSVEMYRFVENGIRVKMVEVDDEGLSVDTIEDLKRVEEYIINV